MIYNADVPGRILPWFTMDIKRRYKCDVNVPVSDIGEILTSRYMSILYEGDLGKRGEGTSVDFDRKLSVI